MSLSRLSLYEDEDEDEREAQLARLLKRLLEADPIDVSRLRAIAASHGLVNARLRSRVWPKLLGCDPYAEETADAALQAAASAGHRDSSAVAADVARCAWLPREGLEGAALAARRQELRTLIDGCVVTARAHYYPGLCDVAAVLLLTCGGARSAACLTALLRGHLRGPAGASVEAVTEQLALLPPLLRAADAELASFLARAAAAAAGGGGDEDDDGADFDCRFALPWLLTLHTHSAPDSHAAQRLFDFLLASPPAAPLYLGAAAALLCRQSLLGGLCDAAEAHHLLSALPPLSRAPAEGGAGAARLVRAARALLARHPPEALQPEATRVGDFWPACYDAAGPLRPDYALKAAARERAARRAAAAAAEQAAAARAAAAAASAAPPPVRVWGALPGEGARGAYVGQILAGLPDGLGRLALPSGERYDGCWLRGARSGVGVHTWPDGARFAGDWRGDALHGSGIFSWPSGRAWAGGWRADRRHGLGVLSWPQEGGRAAAGTRYVAGAEQEREAAGEGQAAGAARRAEAAEREALAAAAALAEALREHGLEGGAARRRAAPRSAEGRGKLHALMPPPDEAPPAPRRGRAERAG